MKALIVGFGKMGMLHAATLNSLPGIEEIIICESSDFVADGIRFFNPKLKVYPDYNQALTDHTVAIAVISTPTRFHGAIYRDLVRRRIHCFVEKPFVCDFAEARACEKTASEFPAIRTMVGHCLRFVPTFEKARAAIQSGELGRVTAFKARMLSSDVLKPSSGWRFKKSSSGGGVLLDLGSHLADMVRSFFGMPDAVSGEIRRIVSETVDDEFTGVFHYPEFKGSVEISWSRPGIRKASLEIEAEFEKGKLCVTEDSLICENRESRMEQSITSLETPVPFDLGGPAYTRQLSEFIASIRENREARNSIREALDNHLLLDRMRDSRGRKVSSNLLPNPGQAHA